MMTDTGAPPSAAPPPSLPPSLLDLILLLLLLLLRIAHSNSFMRLYSTPCRCGMEKVDHPPTDPVELQSKWSQSVAKTSPNKAAAVADEDEDEAPSSQHHTHLVEMKEEGGVKPLHRAALLDEVRQKCSRNT
eukprot:3040311-Rhodomonas_salina.1